jgi:hypothetical protein
MPTSGRRPTHAAAGSTPNVGITWRSAQCTVCRRRHKVHRLRNLLAKLPDRPGLHARVRAAYWAALDGATCPEDAEHGLRVLVGELAGDFPSAAACLADDLPALTVHLRYPHRLRKRLRSTNLLSARSRKSGGGPR